MTLAKLCEEYQVELCLFDGSNWHSSGFCNPDINILAIDHNLSPEKQIQVDLHELGHKGNTRSEYQNARLRQTANLLMFSPEGGINFDHKIGYSLYPGNTLRMIVSKQYLLFYLIHEKEVHILRMINSRTDYLNQLDHLFQHIQD